MKAVDTISVDFSAVLGTTMLPISQLLKLGRGAVIELDATEDDEVVIMANNAPIGSAEVVIQNGKVAVSITDMMGKPTSE